MFLRLPLEYIMLLVISACLLLGEEKAKEGGGSPGDDV